MQEQDGPRRLAPSPGPGATMAVAGAVALLGAVAAGTSAFRSGSTADAVVDLQAAGMLVIAAISVAFGLAVALSPLVFHALMPALGRDGQPTPRRRGVRGIVAAGVAFFVLGSVAPSLVGADQPAPKASGAAQAVPAAERDREGETVDRWIVPVGFGVGVLGAGVLLLALRTRARTSGVDDPHDDAATSALPQAVDASLDAVTSERDPRRAVILAYMRMEATLTMLGEPRAAWETPREYLSRVFADLGPSVAAAATLTELYEEAHFADHQVAAAMRERAIEALSTLRDALGVPA